MEGDDDIPDVVTVPIEDVLDLHPFVPGEIPDVVRDYVDAAAAAGFSVVRLIHGKGDGTQRAAVRRVLAEHPLVRGVEHPPERPDNWGATIVLLRVPEAP